MNLNILGVLELALTKVFINVAEQKRNIKDRETKGVNQDVLDQGTGPVRPINFSSLDQTGLVRRAGSPKFATRTTSPASKHHRLKEI